MGDGRGPYPLLDEQADHEKGNSADDGEHNDDTGFPSGPVLALDELVQSNLAAGDERHVDGGHCD